MIKLTKERYSKLQAHFEELKCSESFQAIVLFEIEKIQNIAFTINILKNQAIYEKTLTESRNVENIYVTRSQFEPIRFKVTKWQVKAEQGLMIFM